MKKLIIVTSLLLFISISLFKVNVAGHSIMISNLEAVAGGSQSLCTGGCIRTGLYTDVCVLCANPCIIMMLNRRFGYVDVCNIQPE